MSNRIIDNDMIDNLKKELMEELRLLKRCEQKQLSILQSILPNEKKSIISDYDKMVCDEFSINITGTNEHIAITLPQMVHREDVFITRVLYEDTLRRQLNTYRINNNITTFTKSLVIFEHRPTSERLRDNDNYNSSETKQIVDALLSAGIIQSDRGTECMMLHITTTTKYNAHTILHVLNMEHNNSYNALCDLIKNSININNRSNNAD